LRRAICFGTNSPSISEAYVIAATTTPTPIASDVNGEKPEIA
jgi:hypothetical protein